WRPLEGIFQVPNAAREPRDQFTVRRARCGLVSRLRFHAPQTGGERCPSDTHKCESRYSRGADPYQEIQIHGNPLISTNGEWRRKCAGRSTVDTFANRSADAPAQNEVRGESGEHVLQRMATDRKMSVNETVEVFGKLRQCIECDDQC